MAPPKDDSIMSGTSIWSFRHLEHQNSSLFLDDIDSARMVQHSGGGMEQSTVVLEDRIFRDSTYKSRQTKV